MLYISRGWPAAEAVFRRLFCGDYGEKDKVLVPVVHHVVAVALRAVVAQAGGENFHLVIIGGFAGSAEDIDYFAAAVMGVKAYGSAGNELSDESTVLPVVKNFGVKALVSSEKVFPHERLDIFKIDKHNVTLLFD